MADIQDDEAEVITFEPIPETAPVPLPAPAEEPVPA